MNIQEQQGMFKTCPEPTPKEGALSKAAGPLARGAYMKYVSTTKG